MQQYAIIVAGGKGLRMGGPTPKQFLLMDGTPIIVHTIRKFLAYDSSIQLIVVLPEEHQSKWLEIKNEFLSNTPISITTGGSERFDSVKAGLSKIQDDDGLVAIHDAVRPFVAIKTIGDSFKSALAHGSGVAAIPLKDSLREINRNGSKARDRARFRLVQTPQTFKVKDIQEAFAQADHNTFTDDAAVFEAAGFVVKLVEGSFDNIKITTSGDIK